MKLFWGPGSAAAALGAVAGAGACAAPDAWRRPGRALIAAGYGAAAATTIAASGASEAKRAAALLRSRYCSSLRERRFLEIGIPHTGNTWRINLAQPLLPAGLADWREAAMTVLQLPNQARAKPRQCGDLE